MFYTPTVLHSPEALKQAKTVTAKNSAFRLHIVAGASYIYQSKQTFFAYTLGVRVTSQKVVSSIPYTVFDSILPAALRH